MVIPLQRLLGSSSRLERNTLQRRHARAVGEPRIERGDTSCGEAELADVEGGEGDLFEERPLGVAEFGTGRRGDERCAELDDFFGRADATLA